MLSLLFQDYILVNGLLQLFAGRHTIVLIPTGTSLAKKNMNPLQTNEECTPQMAYIICINNNNNIIIIIITVNNIINIITLLCHYISFSPYYQTVTIVQA